jgi:hypothetical protein
MPAIRRLSDRAEGEKVTKRRGSTEDAETQGSGKVAAGGRAEVDPRKGRKTRKEGSAKHAKHAKKSAQDTNTSKMAERMTANDSRRRSPTLEGEGPRITRIAPQGDADARSPHMVCFPGYQ